MDYPQLSPGEYCFSVQAVDSDLNYSDTLNIQFTVTQDPRIAGLTEVLRSGDESGEFIGDSSELRKVLSGH